MAQPGRSAASLGIDLPAEQRAQEADALGQHDIGPGHLLLGVLDDTRDPADRPRLSRRARRAQAGLGLPRQRQGAVRLIAEKPGWSLDALRTKVLAELHPAA